MEIDIEYLYKYIAVFFWSFTRIGAALMVMPIIGTKMLPTNLRLILTFVLAMLNVVCITPRVECEPFSFMAILILGQQFIIGFAMGAVLQLVFQIFLFVGELIALQASLNFAMLNDPSTNSNSPVVGQFYIILVSALFLAFDGHLCFFEVLFGSFKLMPMTVDGLNAANFMHLIQLFSWMFASAIKIALPAITALLLINISFGVMTKAAPQLNIFGLGMPICMILGIGIIWLGMSRIEFHFTTLFKEGLDCLEHEILRQV